MGMAAAKWSGPAHLPGMDDAEFSRWVGLLKPGGLVVLGPVEVLGYTPASTVRLGGPQTLAFQRT
mgnify:CR=1 FL=1